MQHPWIVIVTRRLNGLQGHYVASNHVAIGAPMHTYYFILPTPCLAIFSNHLQDRYSKVATSPDRYRNTNSILAWRVGHVAVRIPAFWRAPGHYYFRPHYT